MKNYRRESWVVAMHPATPGWRVLLVVDPDRGEVECCAIVGWLVVDIVYRNTITGVVRDDGEPPERQVVPGVVFDGQVQRADEDAEGDLIECAVLEPGEHIRPEVFDELVLIQRSRVARRAAERAGAS